MSLITCVSSCLQQAPATASEPHITHPLREERNFKFCLRLPPTPTGASNGFYTYAAFLTAAVAAASSSSPPNVSTPHHPPAFKPCLRPPPPHQQAPATASTPMQPSWLLPRPSPALAPPPLTLLPTSGNWPPSWHRYLTRQLAAGRQLLTGLTPGGCAGSLRVSEAGGLFCSLLFCGRRCPVLSYICWCFSVAASKFSERVCLRAVRVARQQQGGSDVCDWGWCSHEMDTCMHRCGSSRRRVSVLAVVSLQTATAARGF